MALATRYLAMLLQCITRKKSVQIVNVRDWSIFYLESTKPKKET